LDLHAFPTRRSSDLYEVADEIRITALKHDSDAAVAGLAAKIDREEAYHRMHAEMWHDRLRDEPRFRAAVEELWPYAVGMLPQDLDRKSTRLNSSHVS